MNTAAFLWLFLTPSFMAAHNLLSVFVWHSIDLRLAIMIQYAAVPIVQAFALAWVMGAFTWKESRLAARHAIAMPSVAVLWSLLLILLIAYWTLGSGTDHSGLVARFAGLLSIIAVTLLLVRMGPAAGFRTWISILPFSLFILVLASNTIRPWFHTVPIWLPERWPLLFRQMIVLGGTVLLSILFIGKALSPISDKNRIAGFFFSCLQPFVIVAAAALAVNGYLYSFIASPWVEIFVTSLALGAFCLLTAAFCLLSGKTYANDEKILPSNKTQMWPLSLPASWIVLTLSGFASVVVLQILIFNHLNVSVQLMLSLFLIPLMQASWLRWLQAVWKGRRFIISILRNQFFFVLLLCFEATMLGYIAFSRNLWKHQGFLIIVFAWVGIKLIILGAIVLRGKFRSQVIRTLQRVCGVGGVLCGAGTILSGVCSNWAWMLPVAGSAFVLTALWWLPRTPAHNAGPVGATAEALVVLLLSISLGTLAAQESPVGFLIHTTYALTALATTLMAMLLLLMRYGDTKKL